MAQGMIVCAEAMLRDCRFLEGSKAGRRSPQGGGITPTFEGIVDSVDNFVKGFLGGWTGGTWGVKWNV